ncbi:hypothetical protein ACG0Z6_10835 [Roseateles sp. BYS180W]|uniref:Secreted protein n=1 Tax=Roseateles rivi TaxID=3299028 RepID=A0ABW7FWN0_9BURK
MKLTRLILALCALPPATAQANVVSNTDLRAACKSCFPIKFPTFLILGPENRVLHVEAPDLWKVTDVLNGGIERNVQRRLTDTIERVVEVYKAPEKSSDVPQHWADALKKISTQADQAQLKKSLGESKRKIVVISAEISNPSDKESSACTLAEYAPGRREFKDLACIGISVRFNSDKP